MSDVEQKIIHQIEKDQYITGIELAENIGVSIRTIEWTLKNLRENQFIKWAGSRKKGYWVILEHDTKSWMNLRQN